MLKEIQRKYNNNKIVTDGRIKATIKQQDCPTEEAQFYVCTVPAGVILKGVTAYLTGELNADDTAKIKVTIGDNNCVFCEDMPELELTPTKAVCDDTCKCMIVDKDYLVKVTIVESPEVSDIELLIDVMLPEHVTCAVKPIRLCTENIIKPYCVDGSCGCKTCPGDCECS